MLNLRDIRSKKFLNRNQDLILWLWYASFFYILQESTCCWGIPEIGLNIYPESLILPYGKELNILCTVTDDEFTADDLLFLKDHGTVSSEKINTTTIQRNETPKRGNFIYSCRNKRTLKACSMRVLVDSPPRNVTDFECISHNFDQLNCTWTISNRVTLIQSSIYFVINGQETVSQDCVLEIKSNKFSCTWSAVTFPRYRQTLNTLNIVLSSKNMFGEHEQKFTIDHFSIVKPDPVKNLKILGVSSRSVMLEWKLPRNIMDFLLNGVHHKIEYGISGFPKTPSRFLTVDTSVLPKKNSTYKVILSDLPRSHTQYEVRIYIKPVTKSGKGYWSDYNSIFCYVGGFSANRHNRTLHKNWEQITQRSLVDTSTNLSPTDLELGQLLGAADETTQLANVSSTSDEKGLFNNSSKEPSSNSTTPSEAISLMRHYSCNPFVFLSITFLYHHHLGL